MIHPRSPFLARLLVSAVTLLACLSSARATSDSLRPSLFVLGDSTAQNTARGRNGELCQGWGTPLADFFDAEKIVVRNVAHAGQSSRTYFNLPNDWPRVAKLIRPGDFVLLVFGINDGGPPKDDKSRGSIPGLGNETLELKLGNGSPETVHTYGWYMTQMANGARQKGAHVYLLTVTTRNIWTNPRVTFHDATPIGPLPSNYDPAEDRIERGTAHGLYTRLTKELGAKLRLPVFDLTNYAADRYEQMGREAVNQLYSDHNHTYAPGAELVAESVVAGLKAFPDSPFNAFLSPRGRKVAPAGAHYVFENSSR